MTNEDWASLEYFNQTELWGNPDKMDFRLLWLLDKLREKIGRPFIIHSGYANSGHAKNSYHYKGQAVDFHVQGMDLYAVWEFLYKTWWFGGLGLYPFWNNPGIHADLGALRRWYKNNSGNYSNIMDYEFLRI